MLKNFSISFVLLFLTLSSFGAGKGNESFTVKITANKNYSNIFQKRAELKLARSTDFCRGFYMPRKVGSWQCKGIDSKNSKCVAKYKCSLINRSFSRVTESRRLRGELGKLPRVSRSFQMVVSKKPLRNPSKYRHVKAVEKRRTKLLAEQKSYLQERIRKRTKKIKEQVTEYDEFAQLEKELAIETKAFSPNDRLAKVDELSSNTLDEDRKQLANNQEEVAPFRMERMKSNTGNEEIIRIKKLDPEEELPEDRKFQILSFAGAMTKISDANASSVATADIAWTPRWNFSPKWGLRGRLGGHFISSEIVDGEDPETFLVYDLGAGLEWHPWAGGLFLSGGLGIQSWTSTTGGAFSTVSLGGGYLFDFNKVKIVDRLFLSYTSVGNEVANKELKVGIGVSF